MLIATLNDGWTKCAGHASVRPHPCPSFCIKMQMSYLSPETEIYSWLLGVESAVMRAIAVGQSFLHTSGVAATHLGVYSLSLWW